MSARAPCALAAVSWLLLSGAAPRLSAQESPAADEAALRQRIAELEAAVGAAREVPGDAALTGTPIKTDPFKELGMHATAGAGDAAVVEALLVRIEKRDGPGLLGELERLLLAGEKGFPTILDLCLRLDGDKTRALTLLGIPQVSFAAAHLVLLHEEQAANLAHYLLAATRGAAQTFTRELLFRHFTVFLRFYRGKYPDLERDIQDEVLGKLERGQGELGLYYAAMSTLEHSPPVPVLEKLLGQAQASHQVAPLLEALERFDTSAAVAVLQRIIEAPRARRDLKLSMALASLTRMEDGEAVRLLAACLSSPVSDVRVEAHRAYFSLPRDDDSLPVLLAFLNEDGIAPAQKGPVVAVLARRNRPLLETLKTSSEKVRSPEIQELIFLEGRRPRSARPQPEPEKKGNP